MNAAMEAFAQRITDPITFDDLVAMIRAEPSATLRRSFVIHIARLHHEVVTDNQLVALGAMFEGKVPAYIAGALIVRRLRRDPRDPSAIRDALASPHAFVHRQLLASALTAEQRAQLTLGRASGSARSPDRSSR